MTPRSIFAILLLACPTALPAQVRPLATGDAAGLTVRSTDTYTVETFQEYKGSDAGLYLEYGFQGLLEQKIVFNNEDLRLQVYQMTSPEAAYGVYSVSVVRCTYRDTIAAFDCQSPFQYHAAVGSCYLYISAVSGSARSGPAMLAVAKAFAKANPVTPLRLPEVFSGGRLGSAGKMIFYTCGPVGLQNCPFPWQNMMYGIRFSMYATLIPDQWGDIFFARFTFPLQADLNRFLSAAGLMEYNVPVTSRLNNGIFREFQTTRDPLTILFLESQQTISIRQVTGGY